MARTRLSDVLRNIKAQTCNRDTINNMFKALLEPLLQTPSSEGLVLLRLFDTKNINSTIKRLEFSNIKLYAFNDEIATDKIINVESNKIWGNLEFLLILAPRYSAVMLWNADKRNSSQVYLLINTREIAEFAKLIFENASISLDEYLTLYAPDRREQVLMNLAIFNVVNALNNSNQEMLISQAEQEFVQEEDPVIKESLAISEKAKFTAHEIKNHLSVIDLYTKIIEKRFENIKVDKELKESINNAISSIKQANFSIVNCLSELRSLSKPIFTDIELTKIVNQVVKMAQPKADEKHIYLENYAEEGNRVHVNEINMQNVLLNIIYNAIDATKENGRITIRTQKTENNKVSLIVKDNGCGIPKENINRIFEEGFTTKVEGNGLGLCICKKLMQEQYGDFRLLGTSENGSEFEIIIPIV